MRRRVGLVLLCLGLGACAAPAPSPLTITYRWSPNEALLPPVGNGPPSEITMRWQPGTMPPGQLERYALQQCLAWDRWPSAPRIGAAVASFDCDRPLVAEDAPGASFNVAQAR